MWQTNTSFPSTYLDNRNNPMYTGCSLTAGLAQEYWRPRILIEIARVMGTLIALDEFTRSSSFGHFARVLVDIDLLGNMPNEISVERDSYAFFSSINYEKLPLFCNFCNNIGHVVTNYNKKAS
ncbi:hypothetical protein JHK82_012370 [Glycine max]|nr:hypothetical protein JHK85_012725 [Glycine max]KAG5057394.1 hypothetical protein JHK86_012390 [Glycine max]KAG5154401.1 hypothetical protein JHK82_012370 [Glycine max]